LEVLRRRLKERRIRQTASVLSGAKKTMTMKKMALTISKPADGLTLMCGLLHLPHHNNNKKLRMRNSRRSLRKLLKMIETSIKMEAGAGPLLVLGALIMKRKKKRKRKVLVFQKKILRVKRSLKRSHPRNQMNGLNKWRNSLKIWMKRIKR
jgi:hypothetical protein